MTSLEEYIDKSIAAHNSKGPRMHLLIISPIGYGTRDRVMAAIGPEKVEEIPLVTEAGLRGTLTMDGKYVPGLLKLHSNDILLIHSNNLQMWKKFEQFLTRGEIHEIMVKGTIHFKSKATIWCLAQPQNIPEELLDSFFIVNPRR